MYEFISCYSDFASQLSISEEQIFRRPANRVPLSPGRDTLLWAAYLCCRDQVIKLLTFSAGSLDLCRKERLGRTALHHATQHGDVMMVQALVVAMRKYKLGVDVIDDRGLTPFLLAQRLG